MKILDLCGEWKGECLYPDGKNFTFFGKVPGCAIHDLVLAGRLPADLFWEKNADAVAEFEDCDYRYTKTFLYTGETKGAKLTFARIDTYADVYLNGAHVYHSENGNIAHEIPVSDFLKQGDNEIEVRLYSPTVWVKDKPARAGAFTTERMYTRRMQCTYGWDWVARFVTCGLGACTLVVPKANEVIVDGVYIATLDADRESATVRADVTFAPDYQGRVLDFCLLAPNGDAVCQKSKSCKEGFVRIDFDVPMPMLWYPLGYGSQPLYTFILKDGEQVVYTERIGIRTVKILQLPDAVGSPNYQKCLSIQNKEYDFNETFSGFILKVNEKKIFCRGANWVPCEPYVSGDIRARQTEILELCAEGGVNMLRVWGGGAFESKHFYAECSRLGITVTQDFLMACGTYPEDEDWFIKELQKEALYAARLMRNEPCLMWWSGDNENAVNGCDTDENYSGRRSAYEGIAPVLYREDPYRKFLPSSPFGGTRYASNTVGTTHNTQYLGSTFEYLEKDDLSDYKDELKKYRARFIAEEPQMGAVSLTSLRKFMTEAHIYEGDELWLYHTKNNPSLARELFEYLTLFAQKVLGEFKDGKDRLWKLRYMQYEWIRVVMEQARRETGFCDGIIFWMMNDCWPAASGWALIDYYNLPKDGYYAFKRCAKPVIVSIDREENTYRVYAVNDGEPIKANVKISLLSADGKTLQTQTEFETVLKSGSNVIWETPMNICQGETWICEIDGAFGKDRTFYREGALRLLPTDVAMSINKEQGTITLSANRYVHAVTLTGEAVFEDNCFSLLPNERRTISYRKKGVEEPNITVETYTL